MSRLPFFLVAIIVPLGAQAPDPQAQQQTSPQQTSPPATDKNTSPNSAPGAGQA